MNREAIMVVGCFALCAVQAGCGPSQPEPEIGKQADHIKCPEGQVLQGSTCVAQAPKAKCAEGQIEKDGACVAAASACAQGTHPGPDGACVPDETAQVPKQPDAPKGPCPAGMAFIKGGSFKLGLVKTEATVGDLCMDLTEATAKEYETCVGQKKCNEIKLTVCTETYTYKVPGKEDHPMVCIDFDQATDYCKAQDKRLPTEEEWEWAARGGTEGRLYSWGNDAPEAQACWSGKEARKGTCGVKEHPATATPQGLLGMSGNVFEWVTRKLDAKVKDRAGRGGSWRDSTANILRTDRPGAFEITYRCGFLGVRCVSAPKSP